jgi:hypothetical protein
MYAFGWVGTWNFSQLLRRGWTRTLMFRVWLCEEGGTWSKGFEINYLITMIEDGRFFVELSQHFFFLKGGGKKKDSSNKKQETL